MCKIPSSGWKMILSSMPGCHAKRYLDFSWIWGGWDAISVYNDVIFIASGLGVRLAPGNWFVGATLVVALLMGARCAPF
jgi:hypothetical protein